MKASLHEVVGHNIKRARLDQNISPAALARYIHRSKAQVDAIESGAEGVTVLMLYALAEALNCKATDLLPKREQVSMPKLGRGVNVDVERMVAEALVGDDPEQCKRWVIGTLTDAVLVNLEKSKVIRRKKA